MVDEVLAGRVRALVGARVPVVERRMFGGVAFLVGGLVPVLAVLLVPTAGARVPVVAAAVIVALVVTGALSARAGSAPVRRAVLRNVIGGGLAMAVTYGVGSVVGLAL
ncbi:VIT1/CCC1 transporter family protein [Cellulomonas septica]|uniref:VIT family protein n=1 Tax=Cellulomonas septica TaxID=285080 RepID=A0ABX1JXZ3_9CELL|nr:VIT1/CCC1 transporter family protein [Cellulomonas septica]NKY38809.1 hypothetical protein [Cellulomonas septica]